MLIDKQDLIKQQEALCMLMGCPGYEENVAQYIVEAITPYVDKVWISPVGNVLAVREGTSKNGRRILLDAHMDEVGFMINHIEDTGFIRICALGSIEKQLMQGSILQFFSDKGTIIQGIVGSLPPHFTLMNTIEKLPDIMDLFVDVGSTSKAETEAMGLRVGSPGTFCSPFIKMSEDVVAGKAMDDRVGCNVVINVLKLLSGQSIENTILACFSVQEEHGLVASSMGAYTLDPTIALAFEGTIATDVPDVSERKYVTQVGKGPAFTIADRVLVVPTWILKGLKEAAEADAIPWQYKKPPYSATDAGAISKTGHGIPSGVVSIPCRYIHSPISIVNINDVVHAVKLICNYCKMD